MVHAPERPRDRSPVPSESTAELSREPMPQWGDLVRALALLTRVPLRRPERSSEAFGRATLFFPLIGLGVGVVLLAVDVLLMRWCPRWAVAIAVIAVWECITAGWSPPIEGSGVPPDRSAKHWVLLAAKLAAVTAAAARPVALLFAPMLACWAIVVLAVGARDAETPGRKFNTAITFREFAITSVFAFVVVFTIAEALGILVVLAVAAVTLLLRLLAHRRYGGVSWGFLSASAQGLEAIVVLLFALA